MFNYRILGILKRELREKLLSKKFLIMTLSLPLIMFVFIGFQTLIMSYEGDSNTKVEIITESPKLTANFESEFSQLPFIKSGYYHVTFKTLSKESLKDYIDEKRKDLLDEKLTGIVFIPSTALKDKKIEFYSKTPKNITVRQKLSKHINKILVSSYFSDKEMSKEDLAFARKGVDFAELKVTKGKKIEEEGYGNMILAYLFTFLLYLSLIMMGQMAMQTVMEEKTGKVVEVLLSSVSSKEFMTGKILGAAITGFFQMAVWLIPIALVSFTAWFSLPADFSISVTAGQLAYYLLNFFIGLITFIALFVALGSIFETPQEAQSGMWPIMMLIIIPFFIAMSMGKNPANPIAAIASMFPFASIIVMPARLTVVDVPLWQITLSIVVNLATIYLLFPLAGKIFSVGILRTGKKPSWGEVVKWLKFKY